MKHRICLIAAFWGLSFALQAQQRPLFSQQSQHLFLLNPAVAGWEDFVELRSGYRRQWASVPAGPESYFLTIQGALNYHEPKGKALPMLSKHGLRQLDVPSPSGAWYRHGAGVVALVDRANPLKTNTLHASYALHGRLSAKLKGALGVRLGVRQWRMNPDDLYLQHPDDPVFGSSFMSRIVPSWGFGLLLYGERFFLSASAEQALAQSIDFVEGAGTDGAPLVPHAYVLAGVKLGRGRVVWQPQALLRYAEGAGMAWEAGLRASHERFWAMAAYRSDGDVAGMLGLRLRDWLGLSYAYDMGLGNRQAWGGSHELQLSWRIGVRQYGLEARYF